MQKRYAVRAPITVYVKGVPYTFNPDHIHFDGLPGYPALPKGMKKKQRDSFFTIELPSEPDVVEVATAAPGEKRTTPKPKTTKKKSTK